MDHVKTQPVKSTPRRVARKPRVGHTDAGSLHEADAQRSAIRRILTSSTVQTKLSVNEPGDRFEREADAVAARVAAGEPAPAISRLPAPNAAPQRAVKREEEEKKLQRKAVKPEEDEKKLIQRVTAHPEKKLEEDKRLQRALKREEDEKKRVQRVTTHPEKELEEEKRLQRALKHEEARQTPRATPTLEARLQASEGKGQPLPERIRAFMEPRFGQDFSQVRVHADADAVHLNQELNAQAFTHQQDMFFGAGKYSPESNEGKRLLAHELAHVVQQGNDSAIQRQPKTTPIAAPMITPTTTSTTAHAANSNLEQLQKLLKNKDAETAIVLIRLLSPDEVSQVLSSELFKGLAISAFDNKEMYRAVKAMHGDLHPSLKWMFEEGTDWEKARDVIQQAPSGHKKVIQDWWFKEQFVNICNDEEMAEAVDLLGGTLLQKLTWMKAEGSNWSLVRTKLLQTSDKEQKMELYNSPEMRDFFVDVCSDVHMQEAVVLLGGDPSQQSEWLRAKGTSVLTSVKGEIRQDKLGPITDESNSGFTLQIDAPPPGKYYFFRWLVRDKANNDYWMRSVDDNSLVQQFGLYRHVYINRPSLNAMFDAGASLNCQVVCRVIETDSPKTPEVNYPATRGDTRLFSLNFDFVPTSLAFADKGMTTVLDLYSKTRASAEESLKKANPKTSEEQESLEGQLKQLVRLNAIKLVADQRTKIIAARDHFTAGEQPLKTDKEAENPPITAIEEMRAAAETLTELNEINSKLNKYRQNIDSADRSARKGDLEEAYSLIYQGGIDLAPEDNKSLLEQDQKIIQKDIGIAYEVVNALWHQRNDQIAWVNQAINQVYQKFPVFAQLEATEAAGAETSDRQIIQASEKAYRKLLSIADALIQDIAVDKVHPFAMPGPVQVTRKMLPPPVQQALDKLVHSREIKNFWLMLGLTFAEALFFELCPPATGALAALGTVALAALGTGWQLSDILDRSAVGGKEAEISPRESLLRVEKPSSLELVFVTIQGLATAAGAVPIFARIAQGSRATPKTSRVWEQIRSRFKSPLHKEGGVVKNAELKAVGSSARMSEELEKGIISKAPPVRVRGERVGELPVVRKEVAKETFLGRTRFGQRWGDASIRAQEEALKKLEAAGLDTPKIRQSFSKSGELVMDYVGHSVEELWSAMNSEARQAYSSYVQIAKKVLGRKLLHDLKRRNIAYQRIEVGDQVIHRFIAFDPALDKYTIIIGIAGGTAGAVIGSLAVYEIAEPG
ncbi:MAG: DUF4157 domain-containing protein [Candidatus Competibacteraceae bacterium]